LLDDWSGWAAACGAMTALRPHLNNLITVGDKALKRTPDNKKIDDNPRLFCCAAAPLLVERRALAAQVDASVIVGVEGRSGVQFCAGFDGHPYDKSSSWSYVPSSWPAGDYFFKDPQTGVLRHVLLCSVKLSHRVQGVRPDTGEDAAACDIVVFFVRHDALEYDLRGIDHAVVARCRSVVVCIEVPSRSTLQPLALSLCHTTWDRAGTPQTTPAQLQSWRERPSWPRRM
jgi:hypothetical protein